MNKDNIHKKLYPPKCSVCGKPIYDNPKTVVTPTGFSLKHSFDCIFAKKKFDSYFKSA